MKINKGNPFYDGGLDPLILIAKNLSNNFEKLFPFTSLSSDIRTAETGWRFGHHVGYVMSDSPIKTQQNLKGNSKRLLQVTDVFFQVPIM